MPMFMAPDDATAAAIEIADVALGHLRKNRLLRVLSTGGDADGAQAGGRRTQHRTEDGDVAANAERR